MMSVVWDDALRSFFGVFIYRFSTVVYLSRSDRMNSDQSVIPRVRIAVNTVFVDRYCLEGRDNVLVSAVTGRFLMESVNTATEYADMVTAMRVTGASLTIKVVGIHPSRQRVLAENTCAHSTPQQTRCFMEISPKCERFVLLFVAFLSANE